MVKVSVVVITYNESRNIARCLESVKGIADDIVVVDSFSTDDTAKIARRYSARVIAHRFDGHIEQKNYAIGEALYPHILSLDADEALSDRLYESIQQAKANWQYDGYYFNRLTNYCGKWIRHGGWYPDRKLRLFDSRKGEWKGKNPHDKYALEKGSTITHLEGDLLHYSYYSVSEHIRQIDFFSGIKARNLFQSKKKASWFKIYFAPCFRFFSMFILRFGFLDGREGYIIARLSATSTLLKYQKLREMYRV